MTIHYPDLGNVGQVLDRGRNVVMRVAPGEGRLELARETLGDGMAHTETDVSRQVRRRVEDLLSAHASRGGADNIPDGVAAGLPGGEPGCAEQAQHLGALIQRNVMELDILPGGDVALAQRGVLLGHHAQPFHTFRSENSAGNLHSNHLHVRLALSVDALPQPEGSEHRVVPLAGHKRRRLILQPANLFIHERNNRLRRRPGKLQAVVVNFLLGPGPLVRGLATQGPSQIRPK